MQPLVLTLKGFRGIRDGLGRDELTLDFERLAAGAALIAIAGANGSGKTTIMDNLSPFIALPSRAAVAGPGGFSYYDHVFLPESEKDLTWAHDGRRYYSQVVIRLNGRRKTEAFLHVLDDHGRWQPLRLDDGTVSDGRVETYTHCVEAICGSAETFFTSVFSAQGKRQLSTYRNAEIKTLLADLLGLDEIRQAGEKASQVVRLLRNTLDERRRTLSECDDVEHRITSLDAALVHCRQELAQRTRDKAAAQAQADAAQAALAQLAAEREVAHTAEQRRSALGGRLTAAHEALAKGLARLDEDREREAARLARTSIELREAGSLARQQMAAIQKRRREAEEIVSQRQTIASAIERAKTIVDEEGELRATLEAAQARHDAREVQGRTVALLRAKAESLRREAGDAALRAADLKQRFGLTDAVPCRGSELQPRCQLLADAREASVLLPSAEGKLAAIRSALDTVNIDIRALEATLGESGGAAGALRVAQNELETLTAERRRIGALAAQLEGFRQAEQRLAEYSAAETEIGAALRLAEERCGRESEQARTAIATIDQRIREQTESGQSAIDAILAELASLPSPFDFMRLAAKQMAAQAAKSQVQDQDTVLLLAARQEASLQVELVAARARAAQAASSRAVLARIEGELGWWNLLAKALGNDGVIALCVDDAGPALSGLANDLLLACYGPRFTVSIHTLLESGKGEQKEGFDIVVRDGETGESKTVGLMSGGERTWVEACLTRAIALYLAQHTEHRYTTLFSDEADGALDPERKRMFMAMKREVLHLGGYEREFFVSQSPELTQMADVVIDLVALTKGESRRAATPFIAH
jgi:DNA repair protein SbcC/Rad50